MTIAFEMADLVTFPKNRTELDMRVASANLAEIVQYGTEATNGFNGKRLTISQVRYILAEIGAKADNLRRFLQEYDND